MEKGVKVNTERALTLALLHDVPEALTHDIDRRVVKLGGKPMKLGKRQVERNAVTKLSQTAGILGNILEEAWTLLESDNSLEAQIVHACDRLETSVQALEYVLQGYRPEQFNEFWDAAKAQKEGAMDEIVQILNPLLDRIKDYQS